MFCIGTKVRVDGEFDTNAQLLIVNHQSMLDIISIEAVHPQNLCWVSKKEITEYPYYGHINKAPKMISVDREDKAGLVKLFADVKDRLADNRPVVIFPEGTRGKELQLLPFKPGAKMIAEKLGLRIQPIVVVDSAGFLNPNHFSLATLSKNELVIIPLESFVPQKGDDWYEEVRNKIQSELDKRRRNS